MKPRKKIMWAVIAIVIICVCLAMGWKACLHIITDTNGEAALSDERSREVNALLQNAAARATQPVPLTELLPGGDDAWFVLLYPYVKLSDLHCEAFPEDFLHKLEPYDHWNNDAEIMAIFNAEGLIDLAYLLPGQPQWKAVQECPVAKLNEVYLTPVNTLITRADVETSRPFWPLNAKLKDSLAKQLPLTVAELLNSDADDAYLLYLPDSYTNKAIPLPADAPQASIDTYIEQNAWAAGKRLIVFDKMGVIKDVTVFGDLLSGSRPRCLRLKEALLQPELLEYYDSYTYRLVSQFEIDNPRSAEINTLLTEAVKHGAAVDMAQAFEDAPENAYLLYLRYGDMAADILRPLFDDAFITGLNFKPTTDSAVSRLIVFDAKGLIEDVFLTYGPFTKFYKNANHSACYKLSEVYWLPDKSDKAYKLGTEE